MCGSRCWPLFEREKAFALVGKKREKTSRFDRPFARSSRPLCARSVKTAHRRSLSQAHVQHVHQHGDPRARHQRDVQEGRPSLARRERLTSRAGLDLAQNSAPFGGEWLNRVYSGEPSYWRFERRATLEKRIVIVPKSDARDARTRVLFFQTSKKAQIFDMREFFFLSFS